MKSSILAFVLFLSGPLSAGSWINSGQQPLLFDENKVIDVTIPVHFKDLCRPREDENCDFIATTLEYRGADDEPHTLPVEIKVRGGWRSLTKNCSAPLLWIRLDKDAAQGTVFQGQSLLPLTTHCGQGLSLEALQNRPPRTAWEQYLIKEYLGQRIYQLFTDVSLRSRLVKIHYMDPDKPNRVIHNYAYFTEHFDSMAERHNTVRLDRGSFDYEKLDNQAADVLALYQFMIGNTDWSIVRQRNTVLVETEKGKQIPVPYDLDMSGLVNAHYAGPAPGLPIDSVTERYYLGFCHPELDWDGLFGAFREREAAVYTLTTEIPGLNEKSSDTTRQFLEEFYAILHSREAREEYIINACKPWPPSSVDHTTPLDNR